MRNKKSIALAALLLPALCIPGAPGQSATEQPWPRPVPCRIHDGPNPELFVMTLGNVLTPLAQGIFDPVKDQVILNDGGIETNYYRDTLGVRFYRPIDKSRFPLPPSGWCSWYFYYNRVNAGEVERNAQWIAANLKDFGARIVQVDDGWQGAGGRGGERDWNHVNPGHFPKGMARLAAQIKSLGLTPGLWLAPHGQSDPFFVTNHAGLFLHRADGSLDAESQRWEGLYLLDPSSAGSLDYLRGLFKELSGWGFDYFKIDGQPTVVDEYQRKMARMQNPPADAVESYRQTLEAIRSAIGPKRYLLGCWGLPIEGAGIMNGSRTGGDVVLGWGGFQVALRPTMEFYYLHNMVWYCDPDVLLVRSPLSLNEARAWASLEGLTGQALMSSDRLTDLSPRRVELLRRVYPATDIRPLDLFPSPRNKRIWDLKISHLGRNYDVVGVFNFDPNRSEQMLLKWADLGLPPEQRVHVFDFWNREYLGDWAQGMAVPVAPADCRVLALVPDNGRIQLVSTSRHITQGWVDLASLEQSRAGDRFRGASRLVKNDPYELRFAFPRGTNYVVRRAVAHSGWRELPVKISNHQGWASVEFTAHKTTQVEWEVQFARGDFYHFPPGEPSGLSVERAGLDGVNLSWREQYYLNAGYQVYLDGRLLGYTPRAEFPIRGLDPQSNYTAQVTAVWEDGRESRPNAGVKFQMASMIPARLPLGRIKPIRSTGRWRGFEADERLSDRQLALGGRHYEEGLAGFANSEVEFDLKGLFGRLTALAGLDADSPADATAEFFVIADGRELWRSGPLKKADPPKAIDVSVAGVRELILRTVGPGGWRNRGQADWVEPVVSKAAGAAGY